MMATAVDWKPYQAVAQPSDRQFISARVDYAVRAVVELARQREGAFVASKAIAEAQGLPVSFTRAVLSDLCRVRLVLSRRGASGGYALVGDATAISVADVVRAVSDWLDSAADAPVTPVEHVWLTAHNALLEVLERITIADVADAFPAPTDAVAGHR